MSVTRPTGQAAGFVVGKGLDSDTATALVRIQTNLALLRDGLLDLSRQIERPILEVATFLESIQDLDSARPATDGGSRLVVALQSYDMFHQEIQLAEHLIDLLTMAIGETEAPKLSPPTLLTNAESVRFHLDSARTLIEGAANDIPHAVSQILQASGASPRKFQNWAFNRSLAEIGTLTMRLGETTDSVEVLRQDLATTLGECADEHFLPPSPEADFENSSITLF